MNIPADVARAQGAHGSKGAAHGILGAVHGIKGGRPRLALTDDQRAQRRRDQQQAYRRRKGIMPREVLTREERDELNRRQREARLNKEFRRVWRKLPGEPLTAVEFAKRYGAFRKWVRSCQYRNCPLCSPVHFVRDYFRKEKQRQRAEARESDTGEDFYDDDDDESLQLAAKMENLARLHRDEAIQDLISSALPPVETPSVGRNKPCPCKSGRKFKKCCGK